MIRLLLQKQSDLGLHCLFSHFLLATSVRIFRTFTIDISTLCTHLDIITFDELGMKDGVLSLDEFIQAFGKNIHVAYTHTS